MLKDNRFWQALKHHYSAPLTEVFKQFRLGLAIFFVGMVAVYASYKAPGSIVTETTLLLGLIVVGVGFIIAMLAQVRMIIIRFVNFIKDR